MALTIRKCLSAFRRKYLTQNSHDDLYRVGLTQHLEGVITFFGKHMTIATCQNDTKAKPAFIDLTSELQAINAGHDNVVEDQIELSASRSSNSRAASPLKTQVTI